MGDTGGRKLTNAVKQDLSDGSLMLWWFLGVIQRSLISTLLRIHLGDSWWPGGRKGQFCVMSTWLHWSCFPECSSLHDSGLEVDEREACMRCGRK